MASNAPTSSSPGSDTHRQMSEVADDLKGQAKQAYSDVKESVSDVAKRGWDAGRDMTREGLNRVEERVQDRPMTSLAIAAAVGFVCGMMTRRHRY